MTYGDGLTVIPDTNAQNYRVAKTTTTTTTTTTTATKEIFSVLSIYKVGR